MKPSESTARALTQPEVLPPYYTTWRPYGPAADLDLNHWVNLPQPDTGEAFTSPGRLLEALESGERKFGLAARIMRGLRRRKLDHLVLGRGATLISEDGSHRRASKQETRKLVDHAKTTKDFQEATAFGSRMFHCLLTDERFWELLSKETDGRKVTAFISTNFKLRLPLATPRVWAQIASDARLRDRFIKILSERPNLVVGWVQVASMERDAPVVFAEIVRLLMTSLDRPHRSIRADLASSLGSPELRQAFADAAKRLAADAQICVSPDGEVRPDEFKPRANKQLPTMEFAQQIEQMIAFVAGRPERNATVLARLFQQTKAAAGKNKSHDAWRIDFGRAIRIHNLRIECFKLPASRSILTRSGPLRSEISG